MFADGDAAQCLAITHLDQCEVGCAAANIDEARAEEARQRAAARLREKLSSEEVASVNAALARSLAQLNVKRRHHK